MDVTIRPINTTDDLPLMREMMYQAIYALAPLPRNIIDQPEFKHNWALFITASTARHIRW
jgi:hypothetical protein